MNKRELLNLFVTQLKKDLAVITQAALATYEGVIHADSKAEDQYDTRGLEASYLAGAQAKRVADLEELIQIFHHIDIKKFQDGEKISATALVELSSDDKSSYFILMPKGGGLQAQLDGKTVHVVTPQSPMGEALLGKKCGDEISVQVQRALRDYEIVSVE